MKTQRNKLICLLLLLSMLMGTVTGCAADTPGMSQKPTVPSAPTTSATTTPAAPTESTPTSPTEEPTEPTVTEPPATEPPVTEPPATEPPPALPTLQPPAIKAAQAFIYDTRTNHFLYTSTPLDTALYPASITKLFTSYVALQFLDLKETVTIGKELSLVSPDASVAGLEKGSTWTVEGLLYAALLPSGCDASYVLAVAAGRNLLLDPDAPIQDALHAFMTQCNFLASELGMENTHFVTPDGYHHKDHYISMMAYPIIAECILTDDALCSIVKAPKITVTYTNASGRKCTKQMNNTNKLLRPDRPEFYRNEAVGLKTGSTTPAGYCLLSAFQVEGGYIIIGVFGCPERDNRFSDTNTLFDYYMQHQ